MAENSIFSNLYIQLTEFLFPPRWRLNLCRRAQSRNLERLVNVQMGYEWKKTAADSFRAVDSISEPL